MDNDRARPALGGRMVLRRSPPVLGDRGGQRRTGTPEMLGRRPLTIVLARPLPGHEEGALTQNQSSAVVTTMTTTATPITAAMVKRIVRITATVRRRRRSPRGVVVRDGVVGGEGLEPPTSSV